MKRSVIAGFVMAAFFGAGFVALAEGDAKSEDSGLKKGPPPPAGMTLPQYNEKGELIRPTGIEKWVFVGSGLGMNYDEKAPGMKLFTTVFIQPEAYDHYAKTGEFPEKTMLALDVFSPGSDESINKHGNFAKRRVAIEFAVKDSDAVEEGWAYYNFAGGLGLKKTAKPEPSGDCYACHAMHAEDDNVFTQFYPRLQELRAERAKKAEGK